MQPIGLHTSKQNEQAQSQSITKIHCCSRIGKICGVAVIRFITCWCANLCCRKLLDRYWKEGCAGISFQAKLDETSPFLIHGASDSSGEYINAVRITGVPFQGRPNEASAIVIHGNGHRTLHHSEDDIKEGCSQAFSLDFSFTKLQQNLQSFEKLVHKIPTNHNNSANLASASLSFQLKLEACAKASRPIMHADVEVLINDFLIYKREYGSQVEKALYQNMTLAQFVDRLLAKRPLSFVGADDVTQLRHRVRSDGLGSFECIGTEQEEEPLVLANYMSYDEMQIASLIGVSVRTPFINSGSRNNHAKVAEDSCEPEGICIGMVGTRFDRKEVMEWQHMLVTEQQNTPEKGYGNRAESLSPKRMALAMWEKFYKVDRFPTYREAHRSQGFITSFKGLLNARVFKERMKMAAFTLLSEANERAKDRKEGAYVVAVKLNLAEWKVCDEQEQITIEAYKEILQEYSFPHVATIEFNWFKSIEGLIRGKNPHLELFASMSDPVKKLSGDHAGKLLVVQYAWNSNSYPGNEYWQGSLNTSDHAATVCSSYIVPLQLPEVNPYICGANRIVFSSNAAN